MSKPAPRDGVWTANGLSADFRFVSGFDNERSIIETVKGQHTAPDSQLTYDPVRDLSPEAADGKGTP